MSAQHRSIDPHLPVQDLDWRKGLPVLTDGAVTLRELVTTDAAALLEHVAKTAVAQYMPVSPTDLAGFEHFIRWTRIRRRQGRHACFGLVPPGRIAPVGLLQLWSVDASFRTAELGFAVDDCYWGTGLFQAGARLLLDFAFSELRVARLEARAVYVNGRGNGALQKLGATREAVLRAGFQKGNVVEDYVMWSILAQEWPGLRSESGRTRQ